MQRLKVIVLALMAVFAISVVAVASASAAKPELVKNGEAGVELSKKTITTKSKEGTEPKLEDANKNTVTCKAEKGMGTGKGTKEVEKTTATFTGCKGSNGAECNTKNKAKGEIVTNGLKGRIGYLEEKAAPPKVGLLLEPEGTQFAEFECGSIFTKNNVTGSLIGQVTPVNTLKAAKSPYLLNYQKGGSAGSQLFTKFEGEATEHHLTSELLGSKANSNEQAEIEVEFEESSELLA
jgi:hypothetical protein